MIQHQLRAYASSREREKTSFGVSKWSPDDDAPGELDDIFGMLASIVGRDSDSALGSQDRILSADWLQKQKRNKHRTCNMILFMLIRAIHPACCVAQAVMAIQLESQVSGKVLDFLETLHITLGCSGARDLLTKLGENHEETTGLTWPMREARLNEQFQADAPMDDHVVVPTLVVTFDNANVTVYPSSQRFLQEKNQGDESAAEEKQDDEVTRMVDLVRSRKCGCATGCKNDRCGCYISDMPCAQTCACIKEGTCRNLCTRDPWTSLRLTFADGGAIMKSIYYHV